MTIILSELNLMKESNIEITSWKSKKNIATFFLAIYMIGIAAAGISIFIEFRNFLTAITCIILVLIGVHGLRLLLWLLFGEEKIEVNDKELLIIKTGSFYLPQIRIPLNKIESFNLSYSYIEQEQGFDGFKGLVTNMSYKRPYFKILDIGRIVIKYDNKEYRTLNGLAVHEGKVIIRKLNELITV